MALAPGKPMQKGFTGGAGKTAHRDHVTELAHGRTLPTAVARRAERDEAPRVGPGDFSPCADRGRHQSGSGRYWMTVWRQADLTTITIARLVA